MTFYQTQQHSVDYQKSILTIWTIYINKFTIIIDLPLISTNNFNTKFLNIFTIRFK